MSTPTTITTHYNTSPTKAGKETEYYIVEVEGVETPVKFEPESDGGASIFRLCVDEQGHPLWEYDSTLLIELTDRTKVEKTVFDQAVALALLAPQTPDQQPQ